MVYWKMGSWGCPCYASDRRARNLYKFLASNFWCKFLVREHQTERVLFHARNVHDCARNLHKKNLAASCYDRHASFLYELTCTSFVYKFLAHLSPALETTLSGVNEVIAPFYVYETLIMWWKDKHSFSVCSSLSFSIFWWPLHSRESDDDAKVSSICNLFYHWTRAILAWFILRVKRNSNIHAFMWTVHTAA